MRGLFATLILTLTLLVAQRASAAPDVDAGAVSCAPIESRLNEVERTLRACVTAKQSAVSEASDCKEQLATTTNQLKDSQTHVTNITAARDNLCSEAAQFAQQLLAGHVTNVGTCIHADQQLSLLALVKGWETTQTALSQLSAYARGESNTLPNVVGTTAPERLVARLMEGRGREPVFYRRLLTDALGLLAPRAWERIHGSGVDAWFASKAPLDADLVAEAQREQPATSSSSRPPLAAALALVNAFVLVSHCDEATSSPACARARQLEQLLESTGPLLVRRRVEQIWSTPCDEASREAIRGWVTDFPTPHVTPHPTDYADLASAARMKLFTCFLSGSDERAPSFAAFLQTHLPSPSELDASMLARVDAIRAQSEGTPTDTCASAVAAMRSMPLPSTCTAPSDESLGAIRRWAELEPHGSIDDVRLQVCSRYARLLWEGRPAIIARSFAHPPTIDEIVSLDPKAPETAFARLRIACNERHGDKSAFPEQLRTLANVSRGFGESPEDVPWRVALPSGKPIELERFAQATTYGGWMRHTLRGESSCDALGLSSTRCQQCSTLPHNAFYDCHLESSLRAAWTSRTREVGGAGFGIVAVLGLAAWSVRFRRARARFRQWGGRVRERLDALGLESSLDPLRFFMPSRYDMLALALPSSAAWERWGPRTCIVHARRAQNIDDAEIDRAAAFGHRLGGRVVFLVHDDAASLDLSAIRAVLDWAGKGGTRAMHVITMSFSRFEWARGPSDLLDVVEEGSLRGNPFEVRGRITSSSQFWNRERLVSGLLADARAGRWLVVTGLRRFGKSSLALEVARRIPGPSAYVDLAGFHHEVVFADDRGRAVSAILRSVCARLLDSARSLYEGAALPDPPDAEVDAAELTRWFRELSAAAAPFASGRPPPMLVVLDELEQLLTVEPQRLDYVLDVLAILLGRLRNALGDAPHPEGGSPVSVVLCAAIHPLLWAPLSTLAHQSIMAAFPSVCVPSLSDEAARAMMRGLGARQGIRFSDEALEHVVRESQAVPLLLRRIGTSLLELYDAEHARQGSLGAVQIGIEAAREAVVREEREGSPLRVWIESEIAEPSSTAGALLRELATNAFVSTAALRAIAERHVTAQLESSAIGGRLSADEVRRRAQEAGDVIVRLLAETGLLVPRGDLTAPDGYELPDGAIRRVLAAAVSASPSAPRAR